MSEISNKIKLAIFPIISKWAYRAREVPRQTTEEVAAEAASAAVKALNAAGYVVVPREPTEAMLAAGNLASPMYDDPPTSPREYYEDMIEAAPKEQT